jgi:stearoyl-CoA desaturase (delta-9 desaturase)
MLNTDRVYSNDEQSAFSGSVKWKPVKSIWFLTHLLATILIAPFVLSFSAFLVFIILTAITLCFGHSLGMHRLLIHRSYECPKWMEYLFVYLVC